MSTPINPNNVQPRSALQSALCEIISAESSLNMPPDPIPYDEGRDGDLERARYLSEIDCNASHAMEHLRSAFALVNRAQQAQEALKTQVYRLTVQLREAGITPRIATWLDECDECGHSIPPGAGSIANHHHAESCSLYDADAD